MFFTFFSFPAANSDILCNFALAFCKECKTYCSISLPNRYLERELKGKPNVHGAALLGADFTIVHLGFVANLAENMDVVCASFMGFTF